MLRCDKCIFTCVVFWVVIFVRMGVVLHSGLANCDIKSSFGHGHSHSHGHSHHGNSAHHNHSHGSSHGHSHSHSHGANSGQNSRPPGPTGGSRLDMHAMPFDDSMDMAGGGGALSSSSSSNHLMLSDSNENFQLPPLNNIPTERSQWCSSHNHTNEDDDDLIDAVNPNVGGQLESGNGRQRQKKKVNINVRAAMVHVIGDFVQSIGVLIAAIIINYKVSLQRNSNCNL